MGLERRLTKSRSRRIASVALSTFRTEQPAVTLLDLGLPPRANDPDEGLAALSEILAHDSSGESHHRLRPGRQEKRA